MMMPLKPGYSKTVVSGNIAQLRSENYTHAQAIAIAYSAARASYFTRYPHGAIPAWLSFPRGFRLREHYNRSGAPRTVRMNPVSSPDTRRAIRKAQAFGGDANIRFRKMNVPSQSSIVIDIGRVVALVYRAKRDGTMHDYMHRFRPESRPLLAASPDGKRLYLLGGAYNFTSDGIVDR